MYHKIKTDLSSSKSLNSSDSKRETSTNEENCSSVEKSKVIKTEYDLKWVQISLSWRSQNVLPSPKTKANSFKHWGNIQGIRCLIFEFNGRRNLLKVRNHLPRIRIPFFPLLNLIQYQVPQVIANRREENLRNQA